MLTIKTASPDVRSQDKDHLDFYLQDVQMVKREAIAPVCTYVPQTG